MSDRSKFLILGASGLLGRHMRKLLDPRQTVATYRSHPAEGAILFDAAFMRLRDTLLRGKHGFSAAFILYGVTRLDECARDPEGSSLVNVQSIQHAIDDLVDAGVKSIFASSDAVFDGTQGMRAETHPTHPTLTYGKQKLAVENYLRGRKAPWVIARLSKLVSSSPELRNLLTEWSDQIDRNDTIRCARDLVFSPADVNDAARALVRMADESFSGVFHVCGPEAIGRLELLNLLIRKIAERRDIHPKVSVCSVRDLDFYEPRPLDVSMQPAKLYSALGQAFRGMDAVCSEFASNRYAAIAGSTQNER